MAAAALDRGYEQIIWIDADALWLGNAPLLDGWAGAPGGAWFAATWHDAPGAGSGHYYDHFNSGVFLLRNHNPQVRALCQAWLDAADENHPWGEQHALHKLLPQYAEWVYALDHAWNSVMWLPQYCAQEQHIVAWHGHADLAFGGVCEHAARHWAKAGRSPK